MMILSYIVGQKYFPVKYNLVKFAGYLGLSVLLYVMSISFKPDLLLLRIGYHTALLLVFMEIVYLIEKPKLSAIFK
jgi:hypothetical protein